MTLCSTGLDNDTDLDSDTDFRKYNRKERQEGTKIDLYLEWK